MNFNKLRTPQMICLIYIFISGLLIITFRFIFPGSQPPLLIFSGQWRLIQGALEFFNLFPALAFSALVIPFGLVSHSTEDKQPSFSQALFNRLLSSLITAIICAVIYGAFFFLALPLVKNSEENIHFKGELYHLAKEQAQIRSKAGEWQEASQFIGICEQVWPNSPELNNLKLDIEIGLDREQYDEIYEKSEAREALSREWRSAEITPLSGDGQSLNATSAIALSEKAFAEKRYFDAHWLATTGERLALDGSPEAANAARLASEAWNMIDSQSPNMREERLYALFNLKLSGYQAMNSGDFISAYYIFQELLAQTPDDPDVSRFLAASEQRTKEYAFFIDEMELTLGEILTGALFSLPGHGGRAVIRFKNLSTSPDIAYGMGLEYMEFDLLSRPVVSMRADYAKLLPYIINGKQQIIILTHALSRYDKNNSWQDEWLIGDKTPTGVILDISIEDFLLLSNVRRGLPNLQIDELYTASKILGATGYISQIFEAEILNRLGSVLFFLPMAAIVIIIGWRFRTKTNPRFLFPLLLLILPVVFYGLVFIYRAFLNNLGILLILSFGFTAALIIFLAAITLILFVAILALAAQHE